MIGRDFPSDPVAKIAFPALGTRGSNPDQGTRSHMPKPRQTNKYLSWQAELVVIQRFLHTLIHPLHQHIFTHNTNIDWGSQWMILFKKAKV